MVPVRQVNERLRAILQDSLPSGPLLQQASTVVEKAIALYERSDTWPIPELPRRSLQALGGPDSLGIDLSAAALLFYAAADIIDDAQDGELAAIPGWQDWDWRQAVNVGNSLLFVCQRVLLELPAEATVRLQWAQAFSQAGIRLSAGQQQDLAIAPRSPYSENDLLNITRDKAGASFGCMASLAPIWAGRPDVPVWHAFGERLGLIYQLASDIWPYHQFKPHQDVASGKLTLPLRFAIDADPSLAACWDGGRELDLEEQGEVLARVEASGAVFYSQMRVEVLKKEAATLLESLDCTEAQALLGPLVDGVVFEQAPSFGA